MNPNGTVPGSATAALSGLLMNTSTARRPVSQDTIPEERLEQDQEEGVDQNRTAADQSHTTPIDNEYLVVCQ